MAGTFAAWRLGTLQARALPMARELKKHGIDCAIVTVPWDMPTEAGVADTIATVELRNTASTGVMLFPLAVVQQVNQIRTLQPRAVHVFKPKGYGGLAGRLLSSRIPLLIDSDDWEGDGGWNQAGNYSRLQRRLFNWQERRLLRDAGAVTAASHLLVQRAKAIRNASPDTVTWVPNGLEHMWAQQLAAVRKSSIGVDTNAFTIVLYSRFAEFPVDWLPRYLTNLSSTLPNGVEVSVVIIGESTMSGSGFLGLKIDFIGYVAYDMVSKALGHADIAIFPYTDSLIARSKNSVKLLELMAAGCAVIASAIGDVPAVGADAVILLDESDPEVFASTTVALLRNPHTIRRLSSKAQDRALTHFGISSVARRLADAYRHAGVLPPCSHA